MLLFNLSSALLGAVTSSLLWQDLPIQKVDALVGYADMKMTLSNATRVPLHLPTFIPFTGEAQHPVFSILERGASESYAIQLAWAGDCTGASWCHLGSIQGSAIPIAIEGRRVPISLRNGIKGYFVRSRCYEYCTEATLLWTEDGYYYAVGIKSGDETTLLRMADSAIELNPPNKH